MNKKDQENSSCANTPWMIVVLTPSNQIPHGTYCMRVYAYTVIVILIEMRSNLSSYSFIVQKDSTGVCTGGIFLVFLIQFRPSFTEEKGRKRPRKRPGKVILCKHPVHVVISVYDV